MCHHQNPRTTTFTNSTSIKTLQQQSSNFIIQTRSTITKVPQKTTMSSYPIFIVIWATTLSLQTTVAVPSIPACTNCTICQYPCRSQPPAPAAATATNPNSPPPITNISVGGLGGNCPPGTVPCCQQQQQPQEPLAGYSPPVMMPYSYVPCNKYPGSGLDLGFGCNWLRIMKLFIVWWAVWGA